MLSQRLIVYLLIFIVCYGFQDVIGVGAIHETEVETIRYDANLGYILLGDGKGNLNTYKDINFYNGNNTKGIKKITIHNKPYYLIANNNERIAVYKEN